MKPPLSAVISSG